MASPKLVSAVSRIEHGDGLSRAYDVALPLIARGSGIECRDVSAGTSIVLTFSEDVSSGKVSITLGRARIATAPKFSGKQMAVLLSGIANTQLVRLKISEVAGESGAAPDATLDVRFLLGDVNGDGVVSDKDLTSARDAAGKRLSGDNFRADYNHSGKIDADDLGLIRGKLSTMVSGGKTADDPPKLKLPDPQQNDQVPLKVSAYQAAKLRFSVSDAHAAGSALSVTATSSNQQVLPDAMIGVSSDGEDHTLTIYPQMSRGGSATVTITASNGLSRSVQTVTVGLEGSPTVFVAQMLPVSGVLSGGSGDSTLKLAADQSAATVNFSYSNLTTPKTSAHINGPADPGAPGDTLFDLDTATANPDGSFTWTFTDVGLHTVQEIVDAINQNRTYIGIQSTRFPGGEIRGQYLKVNGSTTFTPPPAAPPPPTGLLSDGDAARFLIQATYGPSEQEINQLKATGIDAWLEQQFNMPATSHRTKLNQRVAAGDDVVDDDLFTEVWWNVALTSKDQLRQRVAYALSQIFVISQVDGDISGHTDMVASYYDMLANNAFRNYRKLLEDVTLHPAMGQYLDMRGSVKANVSTGTIPNENYPREILQLFSIGLYRLHPDGSLILDDTGNPIPTYDQSTLTGIINPANNTYLQHGMAAAFSGWSWHQAGTGSNPGANYLDPMTSIPNNHETAQKSIFPLPPSTQPYIINAGQTAQKDLADVLNALLKHPNTGPFICRQLIQRLVCSHPSPGYVYRVSKVFADNGQGVTGDLRAVIKAILTDYEARSTDLLANQGFGKLREPVLRTTHLMRALHVTSNSGLYRMRRTDTELNQTPLRAPTVFNFYEPAYIPPGVLNTNGQSGPEFAITSETSTMNSDNFIWNGIRNANAGGTFKDNDLAIDLSTEQALAGNPTVLVARLNKILMAGQMSAAMQARIVTYVNTITASNTIGRARAAVHLVVTSPEYSAQK